MSIYPTLEFTSLPLDVVEQITQYLSTNDLLTCSLVSIAWREIFNCDVFWIKRCKGGYGWKHYAEYLDNQKSQVDPVFELPQCPEETLEPLCTWRIHFMKQIHFWGNWQRGRSKKYTTEGNFNTSRAICYEAENFVAVPSESNCVETWNTEGLPFCEDIIHCAINNPDQVLYVFESYLVILQFNLIQVYEQSGCKFKLLRRILFNHPEKLSLTIPSCDDITDWYCNFSNKTLLDVRPTYNKSIFFLNMFIGFNYESDLKKGVFHVWDFKKGVKIKEENFLDLANTVCDINFYKTVKLVYIMFETQDCNNESQTIILGYNASTQNFTNLFIKINCSPSQRYFFFDGNYILTLHSDTINVWDTSKNNKKQTFKDLKSNPFPFALVILENELIYAGNGAYANCLTFLCLERLQVTKAIIVCYPIYRLMSTKPNLLLLKANTMGTDEYEISVWDLEKVIVPDLDNIEAPVIENKGIILHSFKVKEQFSGILKLSKLISIQPHEFCVTHFW